MKRYILSGVVILASVLALSGHWKVFAASAHQPFSGFAGNWVMHGGGLRVSENGAGIEHFRTYTNCNQQITTNCDTLVHNSIYAGGFLSFTLNRTSGHKAFGTVNNSGYSWVVGTKITLVGTGQDSINVFALVGGKRVCGPKAPAGYCGA